MIIDDYFTAIERGLRQNVQIGKIEPGIGLQMFLFEQ